MVKRLEVYSVALDPTQGAEMRKRRPGVVLSPHEMHGLDTVLIAPMTTRGRLYPSRVPVGFGRRDGRMALDQIRAVDKSRLTKRLGEIDVKTGARALAVLREMFAE